MAGTDKTKARSPGPGGGPGPAPGPVIVLVEPQLGENIGMSARAMLNCGLGELRLVKPRDGWPSDQALAAASGAVSVIEGAKVYETTADAVADLGLVLATTARERDMTKRVISPREGAAEIRAFERAGGRTGVLYGREAKGLRNDDIALADAVVMAPMNPAFSSLNLAQAVFVVGYEWRLAGDGARENRGGNRGENRGESGLRVPKETRPATKAELVGLFEHLEGALDESGFLHVQEKRPVMVRNLRNLFQRAGLTEQEVRTLRGVVTSLVQGRGGRRR